MSTDKSFISPEDIDLVPHKKDASNFISLTKEQKLNVLESLLIERVANSEYSEDILQAITLLKEQPTGDNLSTHRKVSHHLLFAMSG